MKMPLFLVGLFLATSLTAKALTLEWEATPEYVHTHSKLLAVKVHKNGDGLIDFTIVLNVAAPSYVVADLEVPRHKKILVQPETPLVIKSASNSFRFTVPPEYLNGSTFTLGVSACGVSGGVVAPLPGTMDYRFKLQNFLPVEPKKSISQ